MPGFELIGYTLKRMSLSLGTFDRAPRLAVLFFPRCAAPEPVPGKEWEKRLEEQKLMNGNVQHLNPSGLHENPAYTQAVAVSGNTTTIYVGGQNAVDASGTIVGKGDIRAQTEKALKNLETALQAGGAELQHVVKWNVYILHGQSARAGFEAFRNVWGQRPNPPVITGIFVPALAHPDFLVEIDAVAVIPRK